LLALLVFCSLLVACGSKGDLYLPDDPATKQVKSPQSPVSLTTHQKDNEEDPEKKPL